MSWKGAIWVKYIIYIIEMAHMGEIEKYMAQKGVHICKREKCVGESGPYG